jgi:hypothetical protein
VSDVTLQFGAGLQVKEVTKQTGWTIEQDGNSVHYTGGSLPANGCAQLTVTIRAADTGAYKVRALQRLDDGEVVEHPQDGDVIMQPDGSSLIVNHEGPPDPRFEQVINVKPGAYAFRISPVMVFMVVSLVVLALVFLDGRRRKRAQPAKSAAGSKSAGVSKPTAGSKPAPSKSAKASKTTRSTKPPTQARRR